MNQPSLTEIITSIKKGRAIGNVGRIVAIDGPAGAGKTTLANRLKENAFKIQVLRLFIWMISMMVGKTR